LQWLQTSSLQLFWLAKKHYTTEIIVPTDYQQRVRDFVVQQFRAEQKQEEEDLQSHQHEVLPAEGQVVH
jgi:hypothetical protein